jgi:hypothetical protein
VSYTRLPLAVYVCNFEEEETAIVPYFGGTDYLVVLHWSRDLLN